MRTLIMTILVLGQLAYAQQPAKDPALSMKEYFSQVGGNNPAYRAAKEAHEGAKKREKEASLLYAPVLSFGYEEGESEKPSTQPLMMGTMTKHTAYQVALTQNTNFGLKGTISYGSLFRDTEGVDPMFVPVSRYYEITPSIELTQSLWKNAFGSEVRANYALIKANQKLALYSERAKLEGVRIEAEKTYNRLYFARETLVALKDSYEVATKIYSWARGRAANELGEDSEMIQARSAQELRQLELMKAEDEVREASRAFNSMRGISSDQVADELESPAPALPNELAYNSRVRSDELRVAAAQLEALEAKAILDREQGRATLDLYGRYSLNGLDPQTAGASGTASDANHDAWNGDHPAYVVGIRFRAPIFWWISNETSKGYQQEIEATGLRLKREYQEAERDQMNLVERLRNTQRRFELSKKLQSTQKELFEKERARHRRGRTTLFQVLQYEQQYVTSRVSVLQYQNELLNQINELSMYRGE